MDIGEPFLTQYRGKRASFMVKEFVPGALGGISGGAGGRERNPDLFKRREGGRVPESGRSRLRGQSLPGSLSLGLPRHASRSRPRLGFAAPPGTSRRPSVRSPEFFSGRGNPAEIRHFTPAAGGIDSDGPQAAIRMRRGSPKRSGGPERSGARSSLTPAALQGRRGIAQLLLPPISEAVPALSDFSLLPSPLCPLNKNAPTK
jgi:hypothetical protein